MNCLVLNFIKITSDFNTAKMLIISRYFALNNLRIKRNECFKFHQLLISLSGDFSLNPGHCQYLPDNDNKFQLFYKHGFHLLHINVNSLLSKIDELRDLVGHTKPAILGVTEPKLDSSVSGQEVNISGYSILTSDRNRYGRGDPSYVSVDLYLNRRNVSSNSIKNVSFHLLNPKLKPLSIGNFYRPPNVYPFGESFVNDLKFIDFKKSEV